MASAVAMLQISTFWFYVSNLAFLAYYILVVVADWRLFTKAGEKGWKSLIPFYRDYVVANISWAKRFFWMKLACLIIISISVILFRLLGQTSFFNFNNLAILIVIAIFGTVYAVLQIIQIYRLCRAFGHGAGYTVGMVFLYNIFLLILGLGSSEYQGNLYMRNK